MKKISKKAARRLYIIAIIVLSVIFLLSLGMLIRYALEARENRELYHELDSLVSAVRPSRPRPTEPPVQQPAGSTEPTEPAMTLPTFESELVEVIHPETGKTILVLPEYELLYQRNPDIVGWLEIEALDISYPVMQTPDRPDYYLYRDFDRKYNNHGCLYAEEAADLNLPSDNVTIYGHRMSDGSMFGDLIKYTSKSFCEQNPYIYFDTLTQRHTYQVVFVFTTTASVGEGFAYHRFVNADNEDAFNAFVEECGWESFFDLGIDVSYGDKLITLSTCEYAQVNGRLVIVAKRVS